MDISVIGTVMHDEIVTLDGVERSSFGGILYNTAALCTITRATDVIRPFCQIGSAHLPDLGTRYFSRHPQIDPSHIRANPRGTDSNRIVYRTVSSRDDRLQMVSTPMTREDLVASTNSDAIIINFINGQELSLDTMRWLRASARGHIHLDVHNLGKRAGPNEGAVAQWREWFACTDSVQLNEWESLRYFGEKPETEEAQLRVLSTVLGAGPRSVALTLGGGGSLVGWLADDGRSYIYRLPAIPTETIVDTTGCGDSFSAGYVVGLMRYQSIGRAGVLAATISSLNCRLFGLDELFALRDVDGAMQRSYAALIARIDAGWLGDPVQGHKG